MHSVVAFIHSIIVFIRAVISVSMLREWVASQVMPWFWAAKLCVMFQAGAYWQATTPWRKAIAKLEGEPEYEDLPKIDRLEAYEDYMKYALPAF